jgi:hypothetical protein
VKASAAPTMSAIHPVPIVCQRSETLSPAMSVQMA